MHINLLLFLLASLTVEGAHRNFNPDRYENADKYYRDNGCQFLLNRRLVDEISSYQPLINDIKRQVTSHTFGATLFELYEEFIDTFGARPAGSEVLEAAIDHMINLTVRNGVSDVTTEEVDAPHWVRGEESIVMTYPRFKKIALIGLGSSVSTPKEGITAELIVVQSFDELKKTNEDKVKGKVVLFDAPFTNYGDTVAYRVRGATEAAKKGAVASLVRSITPFSLYTPHTGAQVYGPNVTKIPAAAITVEDADLLRRLQEDGQKIILTIKMSSTFDMKKTRNTIIDLKGRVNPEKSVIVSGHIDSWDVGQGAIDDGGGMMISWAVPIFLRLMNLKPRRTVRAILWTAEEPGLVGAAAYLKSHMDTLQDINFIMESDEGTFHPLGLDVGASNKACCIIAEILKMFHPIDKMKISKAPGSDITLFIDKGVPGASLMNANDNYFWYHHTEADTLNVQNMTDLVECAAFWAGVSYVIADLSEDIPRH